MNDPRILTAAELELMHVLWDHGASTVQEVHTALSGPRAYTTVATLLKILEDKGFAHTERDGRRLVYAAAVTRPAYEATAVRDVVQRVFAGDAGALARTLVQGEQMTEQEREILRKLLGP